MNHSTRVIRRPRRARPPAARTAAAIIATVGLALLAAACGSSPSSTGSGGSSNAGRSANSASAVAYTRCVRSHGVPSFPDYYSNGEVPKETAQQLGVSDSVLRTATYACASLNPHNQIYSQAQQQAQLSNGLKFARCMRSHGVPNWPDPTIADSGYAEFTISVSRSGIDPHSAQIRSKGLECLHVLPAGWRLPLVTVTP